MSPSAPKPGYSALRKGRLDVIEARYFLTLTLQRPLPKTSAGLINTTLAPKLISRAQSLEDWEILGIVIMPDHLHLLAKLVADKISIPVRKLKGEFSPLLRQLDLKWQPGYYDHRMRPDDKVGGVLRYMWLNPYRDNLCEASQKWSSWWCSDEAMKWLEVEASDVPPPEWWR